ncbi:MAG: hypothetical protein ABW061_22865 [Polyangiaceae bacterium]
MRKISLSAVALVAVLGVGGVAHADCCHDALSCLGAAATLGASCQIESLIASITTLKQAVESMSGNLSAQAASLITQAQQGVNSAAADLKQVRLDAASDLKNSADQSRAIAHAPPPTTLALKPGAVTQQQAATPPMAAGAKPLAGSVALKSPIAVAAPPKPADPKAVKDAFTRGDALVQDLLAKSTNPTTQVNQAADAAVAAAVRHLNTARQISTDVLLTPLKILADSLLDLLTHPERLFDPTAQINADITRISQQLPAMFDRITNEMTQEALTDLNQGTAALTQIQDSAATAHGVVDAMQRLNAERTQANLDALNGLLPKSQVVVAPAVGVAAPAPQLIALSPSVTLAHKQRITLALDRANPSKFPIVVQQRAAAAGLTSKWQSIQLQMKTAVPVAATTTQRVDKDLATAFAGKKGADLQKKKEELFAEAQKRFGKDPKTLAKVKAYIEAHTPKG